MKLSNLFHKAEEKEKEARTVFKMAVDPNEPQEVPYTEAEQAIIDRFEKLPGTCQRKSGRTGRGITNWIELEAFIKHHELGVHSHK